MRRTPFDLTPDQINKFISKMAILVKNGVQLVAFLTEVDFRRFCIFPKMMKCLYTLYPKFNHNFNYTFGTSRNFLAIKLFSNLCNTFMKTARVGGPKFS